MDRKHMKTILKKIFCLPPVPTLLVAVPSYGLVIYALAGEEVEPALTYAAYFLSAYALIITITGIADVVRLARGSIERNPIVRRALGIPLVGRLVREDLFRTGIALYPGFFINLLYAGIKMFSGIRYRSVWFVTLAVYYVLLAAMRASLLHYVHRGEKNMACEWRRYRLCGLILLFMNAALAGIVILAVHENSGFEYPGTLIYVMALYAFYAVITAVWKVVKFRRYKKPVMSAAKVVNLTAAMVSMLSLETAMLTRFGVAEDARFRRMMTASTGAGVSIIVLGMAVFMILRASKQLGKPKDEKEM